MRDYYPKKSGLSRDVYFQVKHILQGYDRLKRDRLDLLYGSSTKADDVPRGGGIGNPTEQRAIRLSYIEERLHAIGQAASLLRAERGDSVSDGFDPVRAYWNYDYFNAQHTRTKAHPDGPCRKTWNNYKYRFSAVIADKLKIF